MFNLSTDKHYLVALSGGADSVALTRMLHDEGYRITALHCNFHLRGQESDRDEQFVRSLCQKHHIPLEVKHFDTITYAHQQGISIEMAARDLRYAWFEERRQALDADAIAVAHHRDDQAETLLLNLIRGTGLRGLAGMKERNGHIIRPLLNYSRSDILQYLTFIHQPYVTDSTNQERDALRNRIRLDVLPLLNQLNPQATANIAQAARAVGESLPYFEDGIKRALQTDDPMDNLTLLHEYLHPLGFNSAQIQQIFQHKDSQPGKVWESTTHRLLRDRNKWVIEAKDTLPSITIQEEIVPRLSVTHFEADPDIAYLDDALLTQPLQIRTWREGDRFCPFGMKGQKLVSDLLTDHKLNLFQRQRQQVVTCGQDIVWVVGIRSDNRYRVGLETKNIRILRKKMLE